MLSYFIRRELEQHTELAEGIDYPNLYTSALLVPVAIYVAALFSLAVRRTFDRANDSATNASSRFCSIDFESS